MVKSQILQKMKRNLLLLGSYWSKVCVLNSWIANKTVTCFKMESTQWCMWICGKTESFQWETKRPPSVLNKANSKLINSRFTIKKRWAKRQTRTNTRTSKFRYWTKGTKPQFSWYYQISWISILRSQIRTISSCCRLLQGRKKFSHQRTMRRIASSILFLQIMTYLHYSTSTFSLLSLTHSNLLSFEKRISNSPYQAN